MVVGKPARKAGFSFLKIKRQGICEPMTKTKFMTYEGLGKELARIFHESPAATADMAVLLSEL